MSTVNAINPRIDLSVRVFDNFYKFDISVPANEYDAVNSFFRSVFVSTTAADNFTVQVFRVAQQTRTSVLTILDQMRDRDEIRLTADMAYFLNGIRSPSTLLGINAVTTPNVWAARNVRP
jgi:hypothetical protein